MFLLPAEGDVALDMHFSPVFKAALHSPPALTFAFPFLHLLSISLCMSLTIHYIVKTCICWYSDAARSKHHCDAAQKWIQSPPPPPPFLSLFPDLNRSFFFVSVSKGQRGQKKNPAHMCLHSAIGLKS